MRETLLALFELSQIDGRVLELEKSGELLAKQITELEKGSDVIRAELGTHRAEMETKTREQAELEGQIREEQQKQQKWKRRLNEIKSPREYQALSREVEQGERQVRTAEETVLAMMAEVDAKKKVVGEIEERLSARESEARAEVAVLRDKQRAVDAEVREAAKGRPQLASRIPDRVMAKYEQIRKRRGVAVALTDGKCNGCNFVVRPQQMVEIRRLDSMIECPKCGRILVLSSLVEGQKLAQEARG
ncbi:MAG: hypothetical protein HY791_00065 [Deltaproteobacteria bacterium]|nr:hypothetical protein [Deltaproteobacteria bacterium]